ncbi:MAG: type VI secretion system tube protein Hcp [Bacteroidota bacterium]|nr:type VI secretion system tube protein Hcp [Bacteroidota bacterium]
MKKKVFVLLAIIVTASFTGQLYAQEATDGQKVNTSRSNVKNNNASPDNTVVCVGKIRCADGSCTINFDQEIVSPRDAASGLPTGKRQHKPFTITKELDKSSPMLARESPTKQSTGKVSVSDLSVMITLKGISRKLPVVNGQFTMPDDCDDDCDLLVSWSWGETNSGTGSVGTAGSGMVKRYEATFNLDVENGEYMASKHTKTGHVTLMK